jgi:RNA polymerase sigma-70 factor, ECF subfamily
VARRDIVVMALPPSPRSSRDPSLPSGDATRGGGFERDVRTLCERGDHAGAATLALRTYGPELYGFLIAMHHNEADAGESFSEIAEVLWRKLPGFAWHSSLRTWAYAIARNVLRTRRRDARRRAHRVSSARDSVIEEIAQRARTETQAYLRTEKRTRLQALRDSLQEEDRMLLVLRVDRRLDWNELARVLGDTANDGSRDPAWLARESARLRKRFQLVKDKLRALAKREGLLE